MRRLPWKVVLAMRLKCLLVVSLGLAASAAAQEAAPPAAAATPPAAAAAPPPQNAVEPRDGAPIDEVIVPGRAPENLRLEIERLETAVYDRFNALNSNDEFDIHCFERAPTGSNIPQRTCAPNFVIEGEARAARRMLKDGRGSDANNFSRAELKVGMEQKSRELTEEMQRVARSDEQLLRGRLRLRASNLRRPDERRLARHRLREQRPGRAPVAAGGPQAVQRQLAPPGGGDRGGRFFHAFGRRQRPVRQQQRLVPGFARRGTDSCRRRVRAVHEPEHNRIGLQMPPQTAGPFRSCAISGVPNGS